MEKTHIKHEADWAGERLDEKTSALTNTSGTGRIETGAVIRVEMRQAPRIQSRLSRPWRPGPSAGIAALGHSICLRHHARSIDPTGRPSVSFHCCYLA